MKNIKIIFIALILISSSSFGQSARQKNAERQYNNFAFVKAVKKYERLVDTSYNKQYAMRKLGDAFMMLRKPEKAAPVYKVVVEQENVPAEYYFYYAEALRGIGEYDESKVWMKKFKKSGTKDSRVKEFFDKGDFISAMFNSKKRYTISKTKFNTKYSDFAAIAFGDDVYFSSAFDKGVSVKRTYAWNEQPFLDIYKAPKDGNVQGAEKVAGINTIFHEAGLTISSDGSRMYFSRNNYDGSKKAEDQKGILHNSIFTAENVNGVWSKVKPTVINNPNYSVYHPSLTKDGKKLYFASDMPGGFGGMDIYICDVNEDGSLVNIKNIGDLVNTEGNEVFPFIHEEGNLYFSSDGHVGYGLLDVFTTVLNENDEFVNIINLGLPLNSSKDDFAYYLSPEGFDGFVSSNRKGGVGDDDIYKFDRVPPLTLKGQVFDAINNDPIKGATVTLYKDNGDMITEFITGDDGYFEIIIDRDANFKLTGAKPKFTDTEKEFSSFGLEDKTELIVDLNIGLEPVRDVVVLAELEIIYFDLDKYNIRPDAAIELDKVVALMNKYPGMVIRLESHTDSRANDQYNIVLSNNRAKATYEYIVSQGIDASRITEYKGFGETQLVNKCANGVKRSEDEHQLNRRTEFIIIKMK